MERAVQKVTPFLWFDDDAEEAMHFYTSVFKDSRILSTMPGPDGKVMTGTFELLGLEFMALNGGPLFKFNPSISIFIDCRTEEEIDILWTGLSEKGGVLMPFSSYPFSKKYGWLNDQFGVSWQLNLTGQEKVSPCLMFVGKQAGRAKEAMDLYTSLFENSKITGLFHYEAGEGDKAENVKHATFTLSGREFMAMDSSLAHDFTFNEAVSLFVKCETQKEVDELWGKLTVDGGEESQCGWLKDKFGVSWQVIPNALGELLGDPDREKAGRVMQAMLGMKKIDIAGLKKAYEG
jgi:predicted 3-demethylubiquinone-9 3-methyltransferase (glyoxalase superfamily)